MVTSVAVSTDGSRVVTGSADHTARVWDARTGKTLHTLKGSSGNVTSVAVSADGSRVVTGSDDNTVRVWDARTGKTLHTLKDHTSVVTSVAVSTDGSRVVTGSADHTARVWDARTEQTLHTLKGHTSVVTSVAVSTDGSRVVTGSEDNTAQVWEARTGKTLHTLIGHTRVVTSVAFAADGSRLVTTDDHNNRFVWDTETGNRCPSDTLLQSTAQAITTPDGRFLYAPLGDRVLRVSTQTDETELARRLATRPDPEWHSRQAAILATEKNVYGAAIQRAAVRRAMGVIAIDSGNLTQAHAHFLEAALLQPPIPKVDEILSNRIPLAVP